ncbi:hypothetical protein BpHYR1_042133 [Brachionus plicatilis]|uniref:Uncharacterized protein n=1 Tax=Brachionus plicatilis TaxID=10195 RepID=A0A3M7R2D2_BRAPC|nr:hypothetical protein BpHYR1_042133 [Brachionus plicatilis]
MLVKYAGCLSIVSRIGSIFWNMSPLFIKLHAQLFVELLVLAVLQLLFRHSGEVELVTFDLSLSELHNDKSLPNFFLLFIMHTKISTIIRTDRAPIIEPSKVCFSSTAYMNELA